MDLTCYYKAEMPNINNQTLGISEFKIKVGQTQIRVYKANLVLDLSYLFRYSYH